MGAVRAKGEGRKEEKVKEREEKRKRGDAMYLTSLLYLFLLSLLSLPFPKCLHTANFIWSLKKNDKEIWELGKTEKKWKQRNEGKEES